MASIFLIPIPLAALLKGDLLLWILEWKSLWIAKQIAENPAWLYQVKSEIPRIALDTQLGNKSIEGLVKKDRYRLRVWFKRPSVVS